MNTLAPLAYSRNILYEAIGNLHSINNYYCPVNTNLPSQLAEIHKLGGIFL